MKGNLSPLRRRATAPMEPPPHTLRLLLGRDVVRKWRVLLDKNKNISKILLTGSVNHVWSHYTTSLAMPNNHSPDKEPLSLQIPRPLMGKLKRQAALMGVKLPTLVIQLLNSATTHVTLTSEDYQAIADATRKAEQTGKRCATKFNDPA